MGYLLPIMLFCVLALFADIGERGMGALLLYGLLVIAYLIGFGLRHAWRKQAPPFNAVTLGCWLISTFFFAQALSSL